MNVTFLIGNGFDLACGLKSSYPDVYEEYIRTVSETEVIKKFKDDLIANKTNEKWGDWADFEMGMAEYAKNFNNENELIECVSDFKEFLKEYLARQEKKFRFIFAKIEEKFKKNLVNYINHCVEDFYKGVTKKLENRFQKAVSDDWCHYNFINFNYTDVLDIVIERASLLTKIYNIHGKIKSNDLILGADGPEQIKTTFNLGKKAKRVFVKPFLNEENDPEKIEEIKRTIYDSDYICIFGLSLGDSDLTWKNEIVNWVKANKEHHLFIFDYECSKKTIKDLGLKLNEEDDRKAEKMIQLGIAEQEDYSEQIHMPIGKRMFDINVYIEAYNMEQEKNNKTA